MCYFSFQYNVLLKVTLEDALHDYFFSFTSFPKPLRKKISESANFSKDALFLDESFLECLSDCMKYAVEAFQTFPDHPPGKKLTKQLSGIRATLEVSR